MSTTISKGKMFAVTTDVNDRLLALMKSTPELAESAMQTGAQFWHDGILPEHFKTGASQTYGYAPRSITYLKQKGGKPPLVKTGSLRQDLLKTAQFKVVAGSGVELKMFGRVLNLAPSMPQNSDDLFVKHKNGRGYPNLKREIKAITEDEREDVAEVVTAGMTQTYKDVQVSESRDDRGRLSLSSSATQLYPTAYRPK